MENKNFKSIIRESWSVSWAMSLIMLFIFLIGLADVYIAGKFGKEVQAAYGLSFQIYFVFLIIAMALSVGTVSVVSRLFGSMRPEKLHGAISTSLCASLAAGLILGLGGILFSGNIISAMRMPETIKGFATIFVSIYSAGIVFHYLTINAGAVLRACNMIRKSLLVMMLSTILNIGLNFYLSFFTALRFRGIAVSTVISLAVGSALNLYYVLRFTGGILRPSKDALKKIMNISWPSGLLQILWQIAAMLLFVILSRLPRHNIEIMAAFTNGLKIESAIFLPAFAFNMANAVVVGNRLGKGKEEDAYRGGMLTAGLGVGIVTTMTVFAILNARPLAGLLSDNALVVNECVRYIMISLLFEPVMAWGVILAGGLNGAGDTRSVMVIISLCLWTIRIPLSYILGIHFGLGPAAVWWAMNFSVFAQSFFISRRYFSKHWIGLAKSTI